MIWEVTICDTGVVPVDLGHLQLSTPNGGWNFYRLAKNATLAHWNSNGRSGKHTANKQQPPKPAQSQKQPTVARGGRLPPKKKQNQGENNGKAKTARISKCEKTAKQSAGGVGSCLKTLENGGCVLLPRSQQ